jgi:hypothetical protein
MVGEHLDSVICDSCGARLPVERLSVEAYRALEDQLYLREFIEEERMLELVSDFYRRYPEMKGRIKPDFSRIMDSADPDVIELLGSGVPFEQIELPPDPIAMSLEAVEAESEVIEYLRRNEFALEPRLEFVRQKIQRLGRNKAPVTCPSCRSGWLRLDGENWVDSHSTFF